MKQIDLSAISGTVGLVLRKQELVQLNDAIKQVGLTLGNGIVGNGSNVVYVLYGCVITGGSNVWNCTAGAIYYNGEIYAVDAASGVATTSNTYYFGTKRFNDATQGTSTSGLIDDIYENKIVFYGNSTPSGVTQIWQAGDFLGRIKDNLNLESLIDSAQSLATTANNTANAALPKAGGTMTGQIVGVGGATGNQLATANDVGNAINTQASAGTIISGNVTKSSSSGVITTFTAGWYTYTEVGKIGTLNITMQIDLSNNWIANDYLQIDLSAIGTPNGVNPWHGVCNVYADGGAATGHGLIARVNNSWGKVLRLVFLGNINDPTNANGCINASISYNVA